jgi:serine phosphatase RsbU (regulator of sigma subunit)
MTAAALSLGLSPKRAVATRVPVPAVNGEADHLRELEIKLLALQQQYAELNTAIFEAAQVHRRLCAPSMVHYGPFNIASEIFAVRHLPGDFFTVERTNEGLVLALGDIGGKGLAAGMWVSHLAGLIRTHTAANSSPETIVAGVNRDLARLSSIAPLSSLFVARVNTDLETLNYCNAGHPPALLLRANGSLESLSDGGPVLGVVPAASFDCGVVQINPDDALLICSDGILESFDQAEQEFGNRRLEDEFRRAQGGSAEAMLFSVLGAVQDFAAPRPLTDDMTLVLIKRERSYS